MKKIAFAVLMIAVIGISSVQFFKFNSVIQSVEAGKEITIAIDKLETADYIYSAGNDFGLLNDAEKRKLYNYMSENNLAFLPGGYTVHQNDSYKTLIEIFSLTKI